MNFSKFINSIQIGELREHAGFSEITLSQLIALYRIIGYYGTDDWYDTTQNSSPSIQEFIDLQKRLGDRITYHGYVILYPRSDYRVSIEGFRAVNLTVEETLDLVIEHRNADEINYSLGDSGYSLRTWWD
jgi:hypothetical protein